MHYQALCGYILYGTIIWVVLTLFYLLWTAVYNRYFHPLRSYPGPVLASISRLPYLRAYVLGRGHLFVKALHDRYGDVVRIAPDELSFGEPTAWHDIYGNRPHGKPNFLKEMRFYNTSRNGSPNLAVSPTEEIHRRQRHVIGRAFSDTALKDQETLLQSYVDLFLTRLDPGPTLSTSTTPASKVVNMVEWYHYVTFDFMTEYIFGESFGCLQDSEYHPWIQAIVDTIKAWPIISAAKYVSFFAPVVKAVALLRYRNVLRRRAESFQLGLSKMRKRLAQGEHHQPDFISYINAHKSTKMSLTAAELDSNASFLVLAGSETASTFLLGCTFRLLKNREAYEKLTGELRKTFSHVSEITFASVSGLPYLDGVVNESFRMNPSVPFGMPRRVPAGGAMISGNFVPERTVVAVPQWASYRSSHNFTDPEVFAPERWLADADKKYANDRREILQPYSVGPRNCLGKSLAAAEIRLILAKTLWKFDLELCEQCYDWDKQRAFIVWENPPLMVRLISRE